MYKHLLVLTSFLVVIVGSQAMNTAAKIIRPYLPAIGNGIDKLVISPDAAITPRPVAVSVNKGERGHMEDRHVIEDDFWAVFDGHSGSHVAHTLKECFYSIVEKEVAALKQHNIMTLPTAFKQACKKIDEVIVAELSATERVGGSTAICCYKIGNNIYTINVGDSRAIMVTQDGFQELSHDQKVTTKSERARLEAYISYKGFGYIKGDYIYADKHHGLAVARSFGDYAVKQVGVIAEPEITQAQISDKSVALVLASDGIWDIVPSEEVAQFVRTKVSEGYSAEQISNALITWTNKLAGRDNCHAHDNQTVIVVLFKK